MPLSAARTGVEPPRGRAWDVWETSQLRDRLFGSLTVLLVILMGNEWSRGTRFLGIPIFEG